MLYISTRNHTDSFTAYRALREKCAPDGGMFLPLRFPKFSKEEITQYTHKSFGQTVADILNLFFSAKLTAWDVECCIGRNPVRLQVMNHRLVLAQIWQNANVDLDRIAAGLYQKMCANLAVPAPWELTGWAKITIRIALLFGIFTELSLMDISCTDITVSCQDFDAPLAAWYAREMGLPIGTIICGCSEKSGIWDLLHRGVCSVGKESEHPQEVERLIFSSLGLTETRRYLECVSKGGTYSVPAASLPELNKDMFAAVIGTDRAPAVIGSVYRSCACVIDPKAADAYGAMQDYRAKTGESCTTLLLAETSPLNAMDTVSKATGLTAQQIEGI